MDFDKCETEEPTEVIDLTEKDFAKQTDLNFAKF